MPSPAEVARLLRRAYGRPAVPSQGDVVWGLIGTILSQSTTNSNASTAYNRLRKRFPAPFDVVSAPVEHLFDAIRPAGLATQRARSIRATLRKLAEDDPTLRLDFLREMPTPDVLAYLLKLPGVGPKTAACVALFELGRPVFPVDTHILRIAGRLGWVEVGESAEKAQRILEPFIPARLRLELHLNLIAHGRATCIARRPRCGECCLAEVCDFLHK